MTTFKARLRQALSIGTLTICSIIASVGCKSGPDDATLAASVKAQVASAAVSGTTVDVSAHDGVVTLSGTVPSDAVKAQTHEIAKGVEGVKEVRNNLQVAAPQPMGDTSNDTAMRNSVAANLTKYGVAGVSADVRAGVVTLTGSVTRDELVKAMQAANEASPKPTRVQNQLAIR